MEGEAAQAPTSSSVPSTIQEWLHGLAKKHNDTEYLKLREGFEREELTLQDFTSSDFGSVQIWKELFPELTTGKRIKLKEGVVEFRQRQAAEKNAAANEAKQLAKRNAVSESAKVAEVSSESFILQKSEASVDAAQQNPSSEGDHDAHVTTHKKEEIKSDGRSETMAKAKTGTATRTLTIGKQDQILARILQELLELREEVAQLKQLQGTTQPLPIHREIFCKDNGEYFELVTQLPRHGEVVSDGEDEEEGEDEVEEIYFAYDP